VVPSGDDRIASPTIVYNDFKMELLIAHAQRREQQPPACEDDDADSVQTNKRKLIIGLSPCPSR
jgi:hypothetical protein